MPTIQSDWQILTAETPTVSFDTPIERLGISISALSMSVANSATHEGMTLQGSGVGLNTGFGVLPVDLSGFGNLPGVNSPIFLGPAGQRLSGLRLFEGFATIFSISAADGVEASASAILFQDVPVFEPVIGLLFIKAIAFLAGLDGDTNASIGGSAIVYQVRATGFQCRL